MFAAGMTAHIVFMVMQKKTVPWVLSVLAITAIFGFVLSRFEKKWKKAEREERTANATMNKDDVSTEPVTFFV